MLKFIRRVNVGFSPLSSSSKQARTFLNRLRTDKNLSSNPKSTINIEILDNLKPYIKITFNNDNVYEFDPEITRSDEIFVDIDKYNKRLQLEEDIKNAA